MKVKLSTLLRTNFAFPSEWAGKSDNDQDIKISYRYGKVNVLANGTLITTLSLDPFDVGGYMDDDVLVKLLKDNNYAIE